MSIKVYDWLPRAIYVIAIMAAVPRAVATVNERDLAALLEEMQSTSNAYMESLQNELMELRLTMSNLARQTMSQQMFVEERIRSDGSSGIKQTRTRGYGNTNFYMSTHTSSGVAAIHDHPDHRWTVGMGEMVVVVNGVEFRTRHNDYQLVQPSTTDNTYHAVEFVETPDVPPEVLAKGNVQEQAEEMREWFKAFNEQDYSVRDYRKYFKPVVCYLEGAWTLDDTLEEPFQSDRHSLVANSWDELQQQIRYTSFTGTKDPRENFSYLPTAIMGVNKTTGRPIYGQWNYRILCHPLAEDMPTKNFRLVDDLATRAKTRKPYAKLKTSRAGRFRLTESYFDRLSKGATLLDDVMYQIPGKDNTPELLNEDAFRLHVYDPRYSNLTKLNTGYYHRFFRTKSRGAMGLERIYRGFSDEFLFVAETTQPRVASEHFKYCSNRRTCFVDSARFTYAIPLEIIYLSPLDQWNPYNLPVWDREIVRADSRNGGQTQAKAYNGTSENGYYFLTPVEFYDGSSDEQEDPADTQSSSVGVLDRRGRIRKVMAAGTRIFTKEIPGVGQVRMRYPIMPIHGEGSTVWKELNVVKKILRKDNSNGTAPAYLLEMRPTTIAGEHTHTFHLTGIEWDELTAGNDMTVTTSLANGHDHVLVIMMNRSKDAIKYTSCDGLKKCWDRHHEKARILERPTLDLEF